MKKLSIFLMLFITVISCNQIKSKTKETINEGGEIVGKSATEFIEGVSEGIDETIECDISLSEDLKLKGISTGQFKLEGYSNVNELVIYLIFENDITTTLTAKAFDKTNLEMGRAKVEIEAKAGDAEFFTFEFDEETDIEVKSVITIE